MYSSSYEPAKIKQEKVGVEVTDQYILDNSALVKCALAMDTCVPDIFASQIFVSQICMFILDVLNAKVRLGLELKFEKH